LIGSHSPPLVAFFGHSLIEVADEQQVQGDLADKNMGVKADPFAWLGKQGEVNSRLMQDSGSSPNRAARDEQDLASGRSGEKLSG
jgi:hypothetical protein